jgi:hypothetical protein
MSKNSKVQFAAYVAPLVIGGCSASPSTPVRSVNDALETRTPSAQRASELGPYASQAFPMLGAITAICLSDEKERTKFSQSADPERFCVDRYGLDESQARLLMAPGANVEVPCTPDKKQISSVVDALRRELARKAPAVGNRATLASFDRDRLKRYPTVAALYRAYAVGDVEPPASWEDSLTAELQQHPENIW